MIRFAAGCILLLVLVGAGGVGAQPLEQHPVLGAYTVDGDPSDWTGTPGAENTAVYDATAGEWIYNDPIGDDTGDGGDAPGASDDPGPYTYPTDPFFIGDDADLTEVRIAWDATSMYFLIRRDNFITDWVPLTGIAIDTTDPGGQIDLGAYSDANTTADNAWEWLIVARGGDSQVGVMDPAWNWHWTGEAACSTINDLQEIRVPFTSIGGNPANKTYSFIIYSGLEDYGNLREVDDVASQWHGGGGIGGNDNDPDIYDMIGATQADQEADLNNYTDTSWTVVSNSVVDVTFSSTAFTSVEDWRFYR